MKLGIIGGGPAGYVAALRAAQLGIDVVVVEREALGGECTNHGCIPTKTYYHYARLLGAFEAARKRKIVDSVPSFDFRRIRIRKDAVVKRLVMGIGYLFKKENIELIEGDASLLSPNEIGVRTAKGSRRIGVDELLIATGSKPTLPPISGLSGVSPWTNREILASEYVPERLLIIGAGVVGVEMAHIFARFGARVDIVEILPHILLGIDKSLSTALHKALIAEGIDIFVGTALEDIERSSDGIIAHFSDGENHSYDEVLVAAGRAPRYPDGAENIDLSKVDEHLKTPSGVYLAGDVAGTPYLAHRAYYQGEFVAETIAGREPVLDESAMPAAVFSALELGSVGLNENDARERFGDDVKIGEFPLIASGRAQAEDSTDGFVKAVGAPDGKVIGVHIAGENASELLSAASVMVARGLMVSDVEAIVIAHPTMSEALKEAVMDIDNKALHKTRRSQ